jgi:hypothetical protein
MAIATLIVAILCIVVTLSLLAVLYLAAERFAGDDPLVNGWFEEWLRFTRGSDTPQL